MNTDKLKQEAKKGISGAGITCFLITFLGLFVAPVILTERFNLPLMILGSFLLILFFAMTVIK